VRVFGVQRVAALWTLGEDGESSGTRCLRRCGRSTGCDLRRCIVWRNCCGGCALLTHQRP